MRICNELLLESSLLKTAGLTVRILCSYLGLVVAILVVVNIPLDIIIAALNSRFAPPDLALKSVSPEFGLRSPLSFCFSALGSLICSAVIALVVGQLIEGDHPSIRATWSRLAGPRLFKVIATLILVSVITSLPMALVLAGFEAFNYFALMSKAWAVALLLLYVAALAFTVVILINSCFCTFVAVFEGTYYWPAYVRSTALARGRKVWLAMVFGVAGTPLLLLYAVFDLLPELRAAPHSAFGSSSYFLRLILESAVANLVWTFFYIFQALIYLRRRREMNDLTFYDISPSNLMHPAFKLLEE